MLSLTLVVNSVLFQSIKPIEIMGLRPQYLHPLQWMLIAYIEVQCYLQIRYIACVKFCLFLCFVDLFLQLLIL